MSFINPIWLYGLLGLLVPIAIHLWSKKEGKTIKVGSIQFFPESETRQSSKLHLNEIFLLILRSLILALLVMLIAQPILISSKKRGKTTVLIEPSLVEDEGLNSILDTLFTGDYNIKLLTNGLPDIQVEEVDQNGNSEYWQLMREIEQLASDEVIIFSTSRLAAFRGKVPASSKAIKWYTIPPKDNVSQVLKASIYDGVYNLTIGEFEEGKTSIQNITFASPNDRTDLKFRNSNARQEVKHQLQDSWVTIVPLEPTVISIKYDEEFEDDAQLLAAAFRAIEEANGIPIQIEIAMISDEESASVKAKIQVWLSDKEYVYINQAKTLIYISDIYEKRLIKLSDISNNYWLTRRLTVANMMADDLPEALVQNLFQDDELKDQIKALDQRATTAQMITPIKLSSAKKIGKEQLAIPNLYWIIFMALVAIERFVSSKRKQ